MASTTSPKYPDMRMTDTHVFFWHSVLSNWDLSHKFSGERAMNILALRLKDIKIPYPTKNKASSQLMLKHSFNCGEQFMMACKAWLFDTSQKASTLRAILASKTPRDQKALGRQVRGFNDRIWTPASVEIVVASQIARAEVNHHLAELYQMSGNRTFVEGSPLDRIWGVGVHYKQKAIENENNWRGENRLGKCHGLAREALRKQMRDQESKIVETQKIASETGEKAVEPDALTNEGVQKQEADQEAKPIHTRERARDPEEDVNKSDSGNHEGHETDLESKEEWVATTPPEPKPNSEA